MTSRVNLRPLSKIINIIITFIIYTINPKSSSMPLFIGASTTPVSTQNHLKLISNVQVTASDITNTTVVQTRSLVHCVIKCLNKPECLSISFNTDTGICYVNDLGISSPGAVVVYDTTFKYTEITNRMEWHLAFRATHGIGVSVYDTWIDEGHHDDVTSVNSDTIGCLTVDGRLPCDRHLRTWRLEDWKNVVLVKHSFYTDSQEVFYVIFNATGTTYGNRDDHFRIQRIVASSATQLVGYSGFSLYQSIQGHRNLVRHFYLQLNYHGCSNDPGWMLVNDGFHPSLACDYESIGPFPEFMYTPYTGSLNWADPNVPKAQVFGVYIHYQV